MAENEGWFTWYQCDWQEHVLRVPVFEIYVEFSERLTTTQIMFVISSFFIMEEIIEFPVGPQTQLCPALDEYMLHMPTEE